MAAQFGDSPSTIHGLHVDGLGAAFMGRKYGWTPSRLDPRLLCLRISGTLATLGSGFVADRLWARGVRGSHFLLARALWQ